MPRRNNISRVVSSEYEYYKCIALKGSIWTDSVIKCSKLGKRGEGHGQVFDLEQCGAQPCNSGG